MTELSVAVVGCAGAGRVHLSAWAMQHGARITALCDSDGLMAARAAANLPNAAAFTDIEAMLEAETFDIVDVCAAGGERARVVEAALRSGANVLCEMPLALTSAAARSLSALASERGLLLMPAFFHRFHPPVQFAAELVVNDDLGRVTMFRCRFSDDRNFLEKPLEKAQPHDGVMVETALHGIDIFRALLGEAVEAAGMTTTITPGLPFEDSGILTLRSERQALGVIEVSQRLPGGRNLVEIYGTVGACLLDYDTGTVRFCTADHPVWQTHDVSGLNGVEGMIAHFADAVRGSQPLAVSGVDAVRAIALMEAARLRANNSGSVDLSI